MQFERFRRLGLALLAVPAVVLTLAMSLELAAGNVRGVQHLLEIAIVAAMAWAAWRRPFAVGQLLMIGGALVAVVFVLFIHPADITLIEIAIVELVVFMPIVISGAFFTVAGATQRRDGVAQR